MTIIISVLTLWPLTLIHWWSTINLPQTSCQQVYQQGSITLQILLNDSLLHYPKQKLLIPSGQRCSLDVKGRLGGISFGLSAVICAFICNIVYDSIHLHH